MNEVMSDLVKGRCEMKLLLEIRGLVLKVVKEKRKSFNVWRIRKVYACN